MQRMISKLLLLRPLLLTPKQTPLYSSSHRALHTFSFPQNNPIPLNFNLLPQLLQSHHHPFSWNQCRYITKAKERRQKRLTPAVSKLKKYKIKPYSSFKSRFKTLKDGQIRRWHAGKRHNAHLKSKISKRRLRLPALVHPAYAKVMKKLNFYG